MTEQDAQMFRWGTISVRIARAENGYALGVYKIGTDEWRVRLAKTPAELEQLFYEWAADVGKDLRATMEAQERDAPRDH